MRILIAGVGNVLRGDDGFGVEVAQALAASNRLPDDVNVLEFGIAGVPLVQELMDRYDALIMVDAMERGSAPGTIYVVEPEIGESVEYNATALHSSLADAHYADPSKVLLLARALSILPRKVFLIGCQPAGYDELGAELSAAVQRAVPVAVARIESLVEGLKLQQQI